MRSAFSDTMKRLTCLDLTHEYFALIPSFLALSQADFILPSDLSKSSTVAVVVLLPVLCRHLDCA